MKPVIFAGPSIYHLQMPPEPGFDLVPPAQCGDVLKAVQEGRRVIGLIDGVFETGPAVWHKEIMFALAEGCTVLGASSMGAIRAAECSRFGMIGVGQIFDDYRTNKRTADADVAILHGPGELGYVPLTVALVDVDDAILRMGAAGVLSESLGETLRRRARKIYFKSRTWEVLLSEVELSEETATSILDWIIENGPGLKSRDALLLLEQIGRTQIVQQRQEFLPTRFFSKLMELSHS